MRSLRLARQCWTWNTRMGITGELCLKGDRFIQVIEGRCRIVQPLAARILTDPRHGLIRIDRFGRLAARRFGGWSLRGMAVPEASPEPVPAVWGRESFAPSQPAAVASRRRICPVAVAGSL